MTKIKNFLLVFDHDRGELIEDREFGTDTDTALQVYAAKEHEYRNNDRVEIVLIGSDSLDTVKLTHANYFNGTASASRFFAGI